MIVDAMISAYVWVVTSIFSILPTVPPTPQEVIDGGAWVITTIAETISVLRHVLTPALLTASVFVFIALLNFENIYHLIMWVLRKIPVLNIK